MSVHVNDEKQVKLVLTGGTGFIARGVLEAFSAAGLRCRAISRSARSGWVPPAVEWHKVACYSDVTVLSSALEGSDCLLHLADDPARDKSRSTGAALQMCASLIQAAREAGVKRAIFASSIYARNESNGAESYGSVKRLIEQEFISATDEEFKAVILRLPPVYGPGGGGGFSILARLVAKGYPLPFRLATAKRAYLSRGNMASLVLSLANAKESMWSAASGRIFEPSDGSPISTADLIRNIAEQVDAAPRLVPIPLSALRFLGKLTGTKDLIAGAIDELSVASPSELERFFGWRPLERIPESLRFLRDDVMCA